VLYKLDTVCDAQSRVIDEDNSGTAVHDPFNRGYSYDDLNRLLARDEDDNATDDITWSYDKVGNWTGSNQNTGIGGATQTFTSNEDNEYTAAGSLTDLAYDDLGNLIEATDDDGLWRYVYDWSNRLIEVHRRDSQVGYWQLHASYYYDAVNRRVEKSVGSINPVSTWYLCLGSQVVEERAGISLLISDVLRSFVYGQSADDVIAMVDETSGASGAFYYYLLDRIGSVVGLLSDSGSVLEKYDYSEFGSMTIRDSGGVIRHGGSQYGNPYGYTGRRYDAETGLWYYRNRMYDSRMGRFLQRDPAGYVDGVNLYAYVSNSPLVFNDPSGLTARRSFNSSASSGSTFGLSSSSFGVSSLFAAAEREHTQRFACGIFTASPTPLEPLSVLERIGSALSSTINTSVRALKTAHEFNVRTKAELYGHYSDSVAEFRALNGEVVGWVGNRAVSGANRIGTSVAGPAGGAFFETATRETYGRLTGLSDPYAVGEALVGNVRRVRAEANYLYDIRVNSGMVDSYSPLRAAYESGAFAVASLFPGVRSGYEAIDDSDTITQQRFNRTPLERATAVANSVEAGTATTAGIFAPFKLVGGKPAPRGPSTGRSPTPVTSKPIVNAKPKPVKRPSGGGVGPGLFHPDLGGANQGWGQVTPKSLPDLSTPALDTIPAGKRISLFDGERAARMLLGHDPVTPAGRQINFHAADRMVNPPRGRVPLTVAELDNLIDTADKIRKISRHPLGDTVTLQNTKLPGKPQVVVDAETGKRVITVINPKVKK